MKRFCQKICATVFVLMHTLERAESLGKKKLSLSRPRAQRKPMPKAPKAPGGRKEGLLFSLALCWHLKLLLISVTCDEKLRKQKIRVQEKPCARISDNIFFSLPDQAQVSNSYPSKNWPRWMFLIGLKMCLVVRAFALNSHFAHAWIIIILVELKRSVSKNK